MPQLPVQSSLFVSRVKAGAGITVSPSGGTGIVTVEATDGLYNPAAVDITGGTIDGVTLGAMTPSTGKFTTISAPATGTFVANGATPVSVAHAGVTANSSIIITLKTVGGTVSISLPYIPTITPGTGFTVAATALDTSTYNYLVIG